MRIGLIGAGVVGGVLKTWLEEFAPRHELTVKDPAKGFNDTFQGRYDAIFISIPIPADRAGQNLRSLESAVNWAKYFSSNIFIRSTVLPGTNDRLGTYSMPEFLTERYAYEDFRDQETLIVGGWPGDKDPVVLSEIFNYKKQIEFVTNVEAELIKYTHNCFGAMKVTYFNIIHQLCKDFGANFDEVKKYAMLTGFIEPTHTQVPGPDGSFGYGGKCFPDNIETLRNQLFSNSKYKFSKIPYFFQMIKILNDDFRKIETNERELPAQTI